MTQTASALQRNVTLYPWHALFHNLVFWHGTWFLYFQGTLSAADAILLYVAYDLTVTALEVPSGYMSDRLGRRVTLIAAAAAYAVGLAMLGIGGGFAVLLLGQMMVGAAAAFKSGTDSALLYQSLVALGRADEMEKHTLRAWRFSFSALGISALTGGAVGMVSLSMPFYMSALALLAALFCAVRFVEPPSDADANGTEWARIGALVTHFKHPTVLWLFVLGVLMYGFSHIPFVFGQPFITETLSAWNLSTEAPLVSGTVSALMMGLSVLVSLAAPTLRARMGLGALLVLAFAIQVGLAGALSIFGTVFAIALLLLRMVPDSMSTPFIVAHLQPLLGDETRATFLSLKSFVGRLLFAASLALAAGSTTQVGAMPLGDLQTILMWYALVGLVCLVGFAVTARSIAFKSGG